MTRRDWWLGIAALVVAILMHAMLPRYQFFNGPSMFPLRGDRWTGRVEAAMTIAQPPGR